MNLHDARNMAISMMAEHGLDTPSGWTFAWDNARRRFGACSWTRKTISLSRHIVGLNDEHHVRQTVLHEIAHALAGTGEGHGPRWRRIAVSIGDDGSRCYDSNEVVTPAAGWIGTCPTCGREVKRHTRKRSLACGKCCAGRHNPVHQFAWRRS